MGARGSSHIEWDPFTLVCLSYRDLDLIVIALPYVHNRFSFVPAYSLVNHELSLYTRKPAKAEVEGKHKAKVEAKAKTGKGDESELNQLQICRNQRWQHSKMYAINGCGCYGVGS